MKRSLCIVWLLVAFGSAFAFAGIESADAADYLDLAVPAGAVEGDGQLCGAGIVSVSDPPASDLVVNLRSDDTSEVTVPATVTVPAGLTSGTFDLIIIDDAIGDGAQTATITAAAAGWTSGTASIVVEDNDIGLLQFSANAYASNESGGSIAITVIRTVGRYGTASVDYVTSDGTAKVGVDYIESSGTLTFEPGETTQAIIVSLVDDGLQEGNKLFKISLSNAGGGALLGLPSSADITIFDDENPNSSDLLPPELVAT
ncbi:MAG: hypothetical protein JSW39_13505, partial [Desulfobacterales bacterium]